MTDTPIAISDPLEAERLRDELAGARELKAAEARKAAAEAAKLEAEAAKIQAEAAKIQAEALTTRQSGMKVWHKPAALAAILPGAAALLTAFYGAYNGYFSAYFDTQKESLNAKVEVLKAEKIKLEADKQVLDGQITLKQERLKDAEASLEQKKTEFEKKKQDYDREIKVLQSETQRLKEEAKQLAVKLPLSSLLSDPRSAEANYNANYTTIQNALIADKDAESLRTNIALVQSAAEKAESPVFGALLYRTLLLATKEPQHLDRIVDLIERNWKDRERFRVLEVFQYGTEWPKDARIRLFRFMLEIAGKSSKDLNDETTRRVFQALSYLCTWRCEGPIPVEDREAAVSVARDAIVGSKYSFDYSPYSLVYQFNPLAGRLLFAQAWKADPTGRLTSADAGGYFDSTPGGSEASTVGNQPPNTIKATWLNGSTPVSLRLRSSPRRRCENGRWRDLP